MGNSATGKSRFSQMIGEEFDLPIIHLDTVFWHPDWTRSTRGEFIDAVRELAKEQKWVLDGTYADFDPFHRIQAADVVVMFDMPLKTCLRQAANRRGSERDDFPLDDLKISFALNVLLVLRMVLFSITGKFRIVSIAHRTGTPLIRIHQWCEEPAVLAQLHNF